MNQLRSKLEIFHVFHIALSVAMSVFLVALYVRPVRMPGSDRALNRHTQQTIYLMEVKYLSSDRKPAPQQMLSEDKPAL